MNIGEKIKKLRKNKKMTLEQLGEKIGLKKSTISLYEKNAINIPSDKLEKIAIALETNVAYLLSNDIQLEEYDSVDLSMLSKEQKKELDIILASNDIMFFKGKSKNSDVSERLKISISRAYIETMKKLGEI